MKPTLLRDYCGTDVTGWLMSEKLDGWRLMWDGKRYLTRQGLELQCPDSWYVGMPDQWLDGELFAGRGQFNTIQKRIADGFCGLSFCVFDIPSDQPFNVRADIVAGLALPAHCTKVWHWECEGLHDLMRFADRVVDLGGEGAVVRDPSAAYQSGRTWDVLRWVPQDPELNRVIARR